MLDKLHNKLTPMEEIFLNMWIFLNYVQKIFSLNLLLNPHKSFYCFYFLKYMCNTYIYYSGQKQKCEGFRLFRFRSPLLTESLMIYFPGVTKMFQFTPCPAKSYIKPCGPIFTFGYPKRVGYPIRKPLDQRFMTPPQRVSPPYASFLGQSLLGIHYRHYEQIIFKTFTLYTHSQLKESVVQGSSLHLSKSQSIFQRLVISCWHLVKLVSRC